MTTLQTYAVLCNATYAVEQREENHLLPNDWATVYSAAPQGSWGNCYAVFANEREREVVLSIRGTDNIFNWLSDLGLAVAAMKSQPLLPPGQTELERFAHSFSQFQGALEFEEMLQDIVTMEASFGNELTSWFLSLVAVAAVTYGVYEVLGFAGFNQVLAAIGAGAAGQLSKELIKKYLESREQGIIEYLRSNPAMPRAIDNIQRNIQNSSAFKNYRFKVIGHSLGGVMAELCAARLGIECVTFESPGSLNLIQSIQQYAQHGANHRHLIKSYLSAPNIINTLNPHAGTVYRMHLPHADNDLTNLVAHGASSLLNSAARISTYISFGSMSYAFWGMQAAKTAAKEAGKEVVKEVGKEMAKTTAKEVGKEVVKETGKEVAKEAGKEAAKSAARIAAAQTMAKRSFLTALGTKLGGDAFALWADKIWLVNQHSMKRIADFLRDGKISQMASWPKISDELTESKLLGFARDFLPLQKDRPGIRNLLDEDGMRDAQIERIPGYRYQAN